MEGRKTVVVAVDGSEHSKKAFDCRWRKLHFRKPIILTVWFQNRHNALCDVGDIFSLCHAV